MLNEIFILEEMVSVYRFLFEDGKVKSCFDFNRGVVDGNGNYVVFFYIYLNVMFERMGSIN